MPKSCKSKSKSKYRIRTVSCRGKLVNRKTNRCVGRKSVLGKQILAESAKARARNNGGCTRKRSSNTKRSNGCARKSSSSNSVYLCKGSTSNSVTLCGLRPRNSPIQIH